MENRIPLSLVLGFGLIHQRQQRSDVIGFDLHDPQVAVEPPLPFQQGSTFLALDTGQTRFETALGADDVLVLSETLRGGSIEVLAAVTQPLANEDSARLLRTLLFDSGKSTGSKDAADEG